MVDGYLKRMIASRSVAVCLTAAGLSATLGPASGQTMSDALASAYSNNPQLLAERAQLTAVDEGVPQALSGWRPVVTASADAGYEHSNILTDPTGGGSVYSTSGTTYPSTYGLTITQPLYKGGQTTAKTAEAMNLIRAERAHLASVEQSVLLTAATDYSAVAAAQATLDLAGHNVEVLRKELEAVQGRFNLGAVSRTDVAQARAALSQGLVSREQAHADLEVARTAFRRDIGEVPGKLGAPDVQPQRPSSEEEAISAAISANPDLVAARYAQSAAVNDIRVVRSQLLPTVNLEATIQHAHASGLTTPRADDAQVTAQLSVPLYEAGNVYSQSRQAQDTAAVKLRQIDQAQLQAQQSAAAAWQQLAAADADIASLRSQIDSNAEAREGVRQEAYVGKRTVLDVLNADQILFQSQVNLVQTQRDQTVALFTLAGAMGRLSAKDLGLQVTLYDAEAHLGRVRDKLIGFQN